MVINTVDECSELLGQLKGSLFPVKEKAPAT